MPFTIKVTLGRDSTPWIMVEQSTGKQFTFGSRKPTGEQMTQALLRSGFKVFSNGLEVTELSDAG